MIVRAELYIHGQGRPVAPPSLILLGILVCLFLSDRGGAQFAVLESTSA